MLNNIGIGRYYHAYSKIHDWNPLCKLISTILYIIFVFLLKNYVGILICSCFTILLLFMSNTPIIDYLKNIWSIRYLLICLIVVNLIFGVSLSVSWYMLLKLVFILLYTTMILYTTTLQDLIFAFSILIYPFSKLGIPTHKISYSIGLSISFVPMIIEESNRVLKSLIVRGISFSHIKIKDKLRVLKAILFPIFDLTIKRADALSDLMELRGYSLNQNYILPRKISLSYFDIFLFIFHLLLLIMVWKEGV